MATPFEDFLQERWFRRTKRRFIAKEDRSRPAAELQASRDQLNTFQELEKFDIRSRGDTAEATHFLRGRYGFSDPDVPINPPTEEESELLKKRKAAANRGGGRTANIFAGARRRPGATGATVGQSIIGTSAGRQGLG